MDANTLNRMFLEAKYMHDQSTVAMAKNYYDKFSYVYDVISPKFYYHKARKAAIDALMLQIGQTVLNVPIGTGQNFEYFQNHLKGSGAIVGVDVSDGMLSQASKKVKNKGYKNINLLNMDVAELDVQWLKKYQKSHPNFKVDAIICDLGLSGFDNWQRVIENLIGILEPMGRLSVMDWEIQEPSLRSELINWIGGGEVDRPIPAYLEPLLDDYEVNHSFNRSGVFVASGIKPASA